MVTETVKLNDNSNEANPWSKGDAMFDAVYRLLNGLATRCRGCHRITHHDHLKNGQCPDCRS